jgi:hypothetical protein
VRGAALLLLSGVAIAAAGCGAKHEAATSPAALRLQREDLAAVSRALKTAEGSVGAEVAATRAAWPLIANGLPTDTHVIMRPAIAAAAQSAARVRVPALFEAVPSASLTGPASGLAGLFRTYSGLATRGWQMIGASIDEIQNGSPASARFARANVALYIESIYDAHFSLAQVGKQLSHAYTMLGGPAAFGGSLSQAEVEALAAAYSEANDRLHPHAGVRLGS